MIYKILFLYDIFLKIGRNRGQIIDDTAVSPLVILLITKYTLRKIAMGLFFKICFKMQKNENLLYIPIAYVPVF